MAKPARPKIYHIAHVDKLGSILADGGLMSDVAMRKRPAAGTVIGMNTIKDRRLTLPVKCWPPDCVGEYVPFYFCSRSMMLYVIHMANNQELEYRGGQAPILHLEADLEETMDWADANGVRWAFSLSNAGARYAEFRRDRGELDEINWNAVAATDFRPADVKEGKQAEFLMKDFFPWSRVERIGVRSNPVAQQVSDLLHGKDHRPPVQIRPEWYY